MFDPRTELVTHPPHPLGKWDDLSFVLSNRKMGQNHDQSYRKNWNPNGGGVQFRLETMEETDSGVCSPPLWSNISPPRNPDQSRQNSSRKQAIAKGQSELMEMVKNMPESCYELSLKDIVDHKYQTGLGVDDQQDFSMNSNEEKAILGANINKRWSEKNKGTNKVLRSTSIDQNRGMLLKMGFVPFFSFNGSKKKKGCVTNKNTTCAKVSPKPESSPKNIEREWWRKRFSISGESESGGDSSHGGSTTSSDSRRSNSSSSRRNEGNRTSGCWAIFRSKKNKVKTNSYR